MTGDPTTTIEWERYLLTLHRTHGNDRVYRAACDRWIKWIKVCSEPTG